MESYHKRKKLSEEKYGKLIILKPRNDDNGMVDNKQQKYKRVPATRRQITDISDEEGLRLAYETKDCLYQHYNNSFIAGTKDWPNDAIDELKLSFDGTLNKTHRGRTADKHYRSHHGTDTVIGHSLGGAVALSLERQYKKECNNPYGIIQSKTFGSPTVSVKIKSPLLKKET